MRHASTEFRKSDEDGATESIGLRGGEGRQGRKEKENKAAWFINNSIWSRALAERHLRPRDRASSSLPRYRLYFTFTISGPRLAAFMPPYLPSGYTFEIVIYARRRLRHPPQLGLERGIDGGNAKLREESSRKEREGERERKREKNSITVTWPRRSSFSSDEHKSSVMTDRRRSNPSSLVQPPRENVKGLEKRCERIPPPFTCTEVVDGFV